MKNPFENAWRRAHAAGLTDAELRDKALDLIVLSGIIPDDPVLRERLFEYNPGLREYWRPRDDESSSP